MKGRIIGIWGMVFALVLLTEASVMAASYSTYTTKIVSPGVSQNFYGEVPVPVRITMESTISVPTSMFWWHVNYELEHFFNGQWVLQKSSFGELKATDDISVHKKFLATFELPKELFKGHYGQWRIRARSDKVSSGDSAPWSDWRKFGVYESQTPQAQTPLKSGTPAIGAKPPEPPKAGVKVPAKVLTPGK